MIVNDGEPKVMKPGEMVRIPAGAPHETYNRTASRRERWKSSCWKRASPTSRWRPKRNETRAPRRRLAPRVASPAAAQNAPTRQEIAIYAGLHEAAAKGDVAEIEKLIEDGREAQHPGFQEPHAAARRGLS